MIGENIEKRIIESVHQVLSDHSDIELPTDIIETDNIGEVIEKLAILHCRMWHLEDLIADVESLEEIGALKKKIDICFKVKRPKYVEAINRMINNAILSGKSLVEDSVKFYKEVERIK